MSSIKGGGRASLSSEAEESIISLLFDTRDFSNPLLPAKSNEDDSNKKFNDLSDHDKKKERKRFLKKLVKCHNHYALSNKLNNPESEGDGKQSATESSASVNVEPKSGNVRIEIVEAIFKKTDDKKKSKKSSKSSSSKSSKKKDDPLWKQGSTRKTMVLPRSTKSKDLMKQCKAKLNMKKPTRVFFADKDSKMEMDLLNDLSGLDDGAIVYATSHAVEEKKDGGENGLENEGNGASDGEKFDIDPLESVKQAYRKQNGRRPKFVMRRPANERLKPFQSSLDNLAPLSAERAKLPAAAYRSDILSSLDSSRVLVICGATGCGKSTQVPQFILEGMAANGSLDETNIIVTQPRRVAATSLATRVANERNQPPPGRAGSEIGYNVRLARATCKDTKLVYCTVGVLLRMIVNPMESTMSNNDESSGIENSKHEEFPLSTVSHVIIDEVHERDLTTDFALTTLRPLLSMNHRISIVLMSATASSSLFVNFFHNQQLGIQPKVFNIPGRTFPVETRWLEDCEKLISCRQSSSSYQKNQAKEDADELSSDELVLSPRAKDRIDNDFITKLLRNIVSKQLEEDTLKSNENDKQNGAILIFLPGKGEIEELLRSLLQDSNLGNKSRVSILQLHSNLSPSEQWRAFKAVKHGVVKIVLSTNVAETSITIPDISVVIDTGRVKEVRFNASTRIKELVTVWTSKASTKQRQGRAGRTGPGICYKLYSENFYNESLPEQTSPEIVRTPLEELILQICLLEEQSGTSGTSPTNFLSNAPEPPPKSNLEQACLHLLEVGALQRLSSIESDIYRLTPLGYHLSHLPMDAKVGKVLVVGCILQCLETALTIAATLSTTKNCWLPYIPGMADSRQNARQVQEDLIRRGFGGESWSGGCVKGDIVGKVAAYNAWMESGLSTGKNNTDKIRRRFANEHALDHNVLNEIKGLRGQFKDALGAAGLLQPNDQDNINGDDALLTSCCLVAGLYPNIATLMRPSRERRIKQGRLITKDGDSCRPSSSSFQSERIKNANERGKDAYAVYHGKHLSIGVTNGNEKRRQDPFLSDINFVSRFAIILFGGMIEVKKNYILVDNWLKFKVGDCEESKSGKVSDKGLVNVVLISELRKELDNVLLRHIEQGHESSEENRHHCIRVINVVRSLLSSG